MNGFTCIKTCSYMHVAHIACCPHMTDINFILWYSNYHFQTYHRTYIKYDSNSSSLIDSSTILWPNLNYHRLNYSKWLNKLSTLNDRVHINFHWASSVIPWYLSKLFIFRLASDCRKEWLDSNENNLLIIKSPYQEERRGSIMIISSSKNTRV